MNQRCKTSSETTKSESILQLSSLKNTFVILANLGAICRRKIIGLVISSDRNHLWKVPLLYQFHFVHFIWDYHEGHVISSYANVIGQKPHNLNHLFESCLLDYYNSGCSQRQMTTRRILLFCSGGETGGDMSHLEEWREYENLSVSKQLFKGDAILRETNREFTEGAKYKWWFQGSHFTRIIIFPGNWFGTNIAI